MMINPLFAGSDRLPICPPVAGERIHGVACVREWTPTVAKSGNTYIKAVIGHRDGPILLRLFESQLGAWEGIGAGDAIRVTLVGRPGSNGFGPSWDCASVERLDPSHPIRLDLLPPCPIPYEALSARWDHLSAQLSPPAYALLNVVFRDLGEESYRMAPAAKGHHHAVAPFGLWWHSIEVAEIALGVVNTQPRYRTMISTDLLILGGLLHDVGKTLEYRAEPGIGITMAPLASARYHTTLGIQLVTAAVTRHERELAKAGTPRGLIDGLLAIIESHHGQKEFGSPSAPNSAEAWLVHVADLASANLAKTFDLLATALPTDSPTWYRTASGRPEYVQAFHELNVVLEKAAGVSPDERSSVALPPAEPDVASSELSDDDADWVAIIVDPAVQ